MTKLYPPQHNGNIQTILSPTYQKANKERETTTHAHSMGTCKRLFALNHTSFFQYKLTCSCELMLALV